MMKLSAVGYRLSVALLGLLASARALDAQQVTLRTPTQSARVGLIFGEYTPAPLGSAASIAVSSMLSCAAGLPK